MKLEEEAEEAVSGVVFDEVLKFWSLGVRAAAAIKKGGVFDVHKQWRDCWKRVVFIDKRRTWRWVLASRQAAAAAVS